MLDLTALASSTRLLFTIPLKPVQGDRFQPTGFPSLGAATYQTANGQKLLVESAQSMANRFEAACWDDSKDAPISVLDGISHIRVEKDKDGEFITDSMLEAHRVNSVYIEKSQGDFFTKIFPEAANVDKTKPFDRKSFTKALLKYDIGSLIHGVFLESLDGRLRIARSMSAFIEASNIQVAASGGVKNDRVKSTKEEGKEAKDGFGNVPFSRDEFTAQSIDLHVNIDLAQIRGYGLGQETEHLLILLALYKLRRLVDGDMRLRTACDLEPVSSNIVATRPSGFPLPSLSNIESALPLAISACNEQETMVVRKVIYKDQPAKNRTRKAEDDDDSTGNVDEE